MEFVCREQEVHEQSILSNHREAIEGESQMANRVIPNPNPER